MVRLLLKGDIVKKAIISRNREVLLLIVKFIFAISACISIAERLCIM